MNKRELLELKEARINRMMEEQKALERERKKQESSTVQNRILAK